VKSITREFVSDLSDLRRVLGSEFDHSKFGDNHFGVDGAFKIGNTEMG
jgi:hypothetical protein